ncbi:sensor histidine kinase [Pseudonocardia adelaidensis]|uniref:histidine kinase n=1 Tax=Pseudonocardia adelaidensis TaxID=648754 RepID=A0ABP9NV21_9PSEU
MRHLVLRLILATAGAAVTAVTAIALVLHLVDERDRLRAASEADLAALVSLAEVTSDREALLRGIARTPAGREGRLAVHVDGVTVGSSRHGPGGTLLVRAAGPATVEVFVPAVAPGTAELGWAALLLAAGALAAGAAAVVAARGLRPVAADLAELTAGAAAIGNDDPPSGSRPMHVPETEALATSLAALTARFAEARTLERRIAADLSHRLRTPLTALALDASAIEDGPAADRLRRTVGSLQGDVDALIRAAPAVDGPARCDVVEVVRQRLSFWSALAQHSGRPCELHTASAPATIALAADDLGAVVDVLLGNVFAHTPAGTAFAVVVVRHAGWVSLVVDDAGPGVADPAAALSRGRSSRSEGTGLGLDIARDAVEATGGTIHVERAALGGARIRLRFAEAG